MSNCDEASSNGDIDGQHSRPDVIQEWHALDSANHTGNVTDAMKASSESIPRNVLNTNRSFEDQVLRSSVIGRRVLSTTTGSEQFKEQLFLNTLRSSMLEKGCFLGDGWHVEFVQSPYGYSPNPFALYCAPDGKKFESMYDVAHYLGVSSGCTPIEVDERSDGCGSVQRLLPRRRRKKNTSRISATGKFTEKNDSARANCQVELCSDTQYYDAKSASRVATTCMEINGLSDSQNFSIGLPLQYEDFFVLRLGKIDTRAAYHNSHQIWPIGYKSIWHDKITGSFFQCEVSDGGESGPVFNVKRSPCSLSPIPSGKTILLHNKAKKVKSVERIESYGKIFDASAEKEDIFTPLSDPNLSEQVLLSCFGNDTIGHSYGSSLQMGVGRPDCVLPNPNSHPGWYADPSDKSYSLRDEIGEFYVEGKSSSLVWKMVSHTLIDACHEVYKRSGCLQFCCRHEYVPACLDGENLKNVQHIGSLSRFCCASGPIDIPRVFGSDIALEDSFRSLTKWLEQDRFGLDMGFVQEIIETLPASCACSQYQFLIDRSDFSLSCTVGSGLLLATQKNGERGVEKVSYGPHSGENGSKLQESPVAPPSDAVRPPGQPLSGRLPGEVVNDVFQIWAFLWRFYEILGLKEPVSFEELEEELIDPWPRVLNLLRKIEKENHPSSLGNDTVGYSVSLPTGVPDSTMHRQNLFVSFPVEIAATRQTTQEASQTYRSCKGVALTKVHISLLKVLVGELLNKVAVFIDPDKDAGNSKARRGRKKNVAIPSVNETKKELLIFNELTWSELARRYVLAVLSTNGCKADVSGPESLKVYRCLRGDGGVLCGSLSGIAGMEADALLLAEVERQISHSTKRVNDSLPVDCKHSEVASTSKPAVVTSDDLPEWAQPLEPVRKLPTNVGSRIRKCIWDSLDKNPPEWAKEILENSVSKDVFKGNASGPTKRAVLSILATLTSGSHQQKPKKAWMGKLPPTALDAIMKKCHHVLRDTLSTDKSKTFCNLIGTTLLNSSDDNAKGILVSPAMVSRPLDFRTIDLRLAAGAYGGSHETFLEDVQEVWHNLRTTYADQPVLMQKLKVLSGCFESSYKGKVLGLLDKISQHFGTKGLDAQIEKDFNEMLLCKNEISKAPWESGVCKVCGIDKDDASVLLCDKCDSEYHKYCLNPPLTRIPDGDWFCPSCVADPHGAQDRRQCKQAVPNHLRRNQSDGTRSFREAMHQLACSMEVKEYWELNTEERILLLKFLCDEVLNTALLRGHLEQCAEKSNNEQKKMYALTIDLRNLKLKEELIAKTVTEHTGKSSGSRDIVKEDCTAAMLANQRRLVEQKQRYSNKAIYAINFSGSPLRRASAHKENGQTDANQNYSQLLNGMNGKHVDGSKPQTTHILQNSVASECGINTIDGHVLNKAIVNGNRFSIIDATNGNELSPSHQNTVQGNHFDVAASLTECEASNLEVNSLKNKISQLQDSIAGLESQVMFTSLRREFLGRDSIGRLYWDISLPGKRRRLVVSGSMMAPQENLKTNEKEATNSSSTCTLASSSYVNLRQCDCNVNLWNSSPLVLYDSDSEINQLLCCLEDADPGEKILKESILQWQRPACYQENIYSRIDPQPNSSICENLVASCFLITKAAAILEKKYGPCLEPEVSDIPQNRGRRGKAKNEERMYRCECLERVWPSRHHCLSCHLTFSFLNDFNCHNDGKCARTISAAHESKEIDDRIKGKGKRSDSTKGKDHFDDVDAVDKSIKGKLGTRPIAYTEAGNHASSEVRGSKFIGNCIIPEPSLRPLVGKVSHVLKLLKISLLDMEAALPEEALRPSKCHIRRCAWGAFVKSAKSIFEMIEATILLEGMIKTDYLKNRWWYWSSLTAAARTSTISSLALRIYTLDDCILYIKDKDPQTTRSGDHPAESSSLANKTAGKKRKK